MNPPSIGLCPLVTGGAGFIGTNVTAALLDKHRKVMIYDNLSRPGVTHNFRWLRDTYGDRVELIQGDVRDAELLRKTVARACQVFHFAAQVAVTTSLQDPILDFEINARGTLNVLEAVRATGREIPLLFTSTNKVYGELEGIDLVRGESRYAPADDSPMRRGVPESRPVAFHSPYGCSKGAADQYVLDYAKTFGLKTVVFRMSCIYGPHQFGTEDQGWVAHFLLKAIQGEEITIYGDGRQVRDVLYVDDLVKAMLLAHERIDRVSGKAFNIGGGPENAVSLIDLLSMIRKLDRHEPKVAGDEWRRADQRYYVSDIAAFHELTGWSPDVPAPEGIARLHRWLRENHQSPERTLKGKASHAAAV